MSPNNDPLQPTPFDVAQPDPAPATEPPGRSPQGTPKWVFPALGGLVALAVLVIFWLPERVSSPAPGAEIAQTSGTPASSGNATPAAKPSPATEGASPWSEAQLAKLRKEAQDVLQQLLDIQFTLEESGARQWATEDFAAAGALAAAADELYKTREYEAAKAQYQDSLAAFQALQDSIPDRVDAQLLRATEAVETGDIAAATTALEMAQLIEPENPQLAPLRQRVEALPQLLATMEQAAVAEQQGDLASAEQLLDEAVTIDPQHQRAAAERDRVSLAHREQRFNDAMSDGYAALDENRFDSARKAFRAAAKLQPGSSEAASALQEVGTAETAYLLSSLKQKGNAFEQQEQWQAAVDAYETAQKIDTSILYATEGLQRSRSRARLDKQFRTTLDKPERLSDVAVAEATEQLLAQARQISPRGPVLAGQIEQLQRLLEQANTPVNITLRSDEQTEVIVYKVARLGRFQQRELTLRPGTYTAVGTRNGYRDVRHSFTVSHDRAPPPLTIACVEPI